jgi:hypothetical protein
LADRIGGLSEDDRDRAGLPAQRFDGAAECHNDLRAERHQFRRAALEK